ncbi:MAG: oligosaccharide flippase family protein [Dorea sp.]|nr:oligosaccharide flippase family protein [Dorea sp.]
MISNISSIFGNGLSGSEYKIAKILMMLMVFNLALTFPNSVFNSYISAHEEFIFQKTMNVLHNIMNPFITLPLLILGYGSIGMVLVTTFLTIVSFIVNILYCMKNLKMKFQFHDIQFSKFKELWSFTFFIFLNQIIDQINWSVDKFLIPDEY